MKNYVTILLIFVSLSAVCQKWTYNVETDSFKGKRKIARIEGKNNQSATKPVLMIRTSERDSMDLSFIITAGGHDCGQRQIQVRFEGDNKVYTFRSIAGTDKSNWLLEYECFDYNGNLTITDLLEKMKSNTVIYFHLKSECYISDLEFSLSGASEAIDYVASDYIKTIKRLQAKFNVLKDS